MAHDQNQEQAIRSLSGECAGFPDPKGKCATCPDYHAGRCALVLTQAVMDNTHALLAYLNSGFTFVLANRAYVEASGHAYDELIGRSHFELFPSAETEAVFRQVRETGQPARFKASPFAFGCRPRQGESYWDWSLSPVKDLQGTIQGFILSMLDVTEGVRTEQALRESKDNLQVIFDSVHDAILIHDVDGAILDVNARMLDMYGVSREDALRLNIKDDFSTPDNPIEALDGVWQDIISGESRLFEWKARRPGDGSTFDAEVFLRRINLSGRNVILATVRDISQSKETLETLRRTQEKLGAFRNALDSSPDNIFFIDPRAMRFVDVNDSASRTLEYSREELLSLGPLDIKPRFTREELSSCFARVLSEGRGVIETVHRRKDGSEFDVEVYLHPVLSNGKSMLVAVARDVTERRRMEADLLAAKVASEQRAVELDAAIESSADGFIILKGDGRLTRINTSARTMLRLTPEAIRIAAETGLTPFEVETPEGIKVPLEDMPIMRAFGGETVRNEEYRMCLNGRKEPFHGSFSAAPIRVPDGRQMGIVLTFSDITMRKRLEEDLVRARDAAEAANRAKSDFLANMSHEIRTPLNGVMGMTDLALSSCGDNKARMYLTMAKQSARSLLDLINDILDFSKIEAGKIRLDEQEFDLREMLQATLSPLGLRAREKGLELALRVEPGVPMRVRGDQGRVRQVLVNLVDNAIKFTERGEVAVRVSPQAVADGDVAAGSARLLIEVRDTGIGMPRDKLGHIFESFYQIGSSAHTKFGGAGLGLAITRSLVEIMGGRIKAESEPGRGSTFSFTITVGLAQPQERQAARAEVREVVPEDTCAASPGLGPLDILLVEDNVINQILATELLQGECHRVTVADDGKKALEALRTSRFDIVLMDIRMPDMDGMEATTAIRSGAVPGADPAVPIVALTAHALAGDRERFMAAGMDDYLSKPIDAEHLHEVLERVMGKRGRTRDGSH